MNILEEIKFLQSLSNSNNKVLHDFDILKYRIKKTFIIEKCEKRIAYLNKRKKLLYFNKININLFKYIYFYIIYIILYICRIHPVLIYLYLFFKIKKNNYLNVDDNEMYLEKNLKSYVGFYLNQITLFNVFNYKNKLLNEYISLSLQELQNSCKQMYVDYIHSFYIYHFSTKELRKEYSETSSVFNLFDIKNKKVLNICAGNACGLQYLDCNITCVDIEKYMGMCILEIMNACTFIECDITTQKFIEISMNFNIWVSIHACKNLAIVIIQHFIKYASKNSTLYLVPCCTLKLNNYKKLFDYNHYNRIFKFYQTPYKNDKLRHKRAPALHLEYLSSICNDFKYKIKTLKHMKSLNNEEGSKNKIIIIYK